MKKIFTIFFAFMACYHTKAEQSFNGLFDYHRINLNVNYIENINNISTIYYPVSITNILNHENNVNLFNHNSSSYLDICTNPLFIPSQELSIFCQINSRFINEYFCIRLASSEASTFLSNSKEEIDYIGIYSRSTPKDISDVYKQDADILVNDAVLCTGETGILTATGCTGTITWSGGGTPNGSTLSVNFAGTYTATCNVSSGDSTESTSDTGIVIINPPVIVNINDLVLCYGETGTLKANGCAGTVTWNAGGSGSSIIVYSPGTYVATCKVSNNGKECKATDQVVVKVNSQIQVSVNDIVLCNGTTGTLTAVGCYGTVSWSGGGTPNGMSIAVNAVGTYTATCTRTENGKQCSESDHGKVFINPPINLNVDDILVPPGGIGTLTATGCNGNSTVTWTGGGTPNGSTLSVNIGGTYTATCKVTSNGKECFASDSGVVILDIPTNYVEFGVNNTRNPSAIFDAYSNNKGVLLPRIDFNNRPTTNLVSGLLIYVIANGAQGNNCFYYYNGTAWVKLG